MKKTRTWFASEFNTSSLRPLVVASFWFVLLGFIVLGPLVRPGYLLLLDLPTGPNPSWPSLTPIPSDGLVASSAPFAAFVRTIAIMSPEITNKLLVLGVIVAGGIGFARFAIGTLRLSPIAATCSATLFVINPFVYDRLLAGQVFFAFGYALLPWALSAYATVASNGGPSDALRAISWTAVISLVDIHVGGFALVLLVVALAISHLAVNRRALLISAGLLALLSVNLFWVLPAFLAEESSRLGGGDLVAYAPRPHSPAVLPEALLLHGFWRTEFKNPLEDSGALFLVATIPLLSAAAAGFIAAMRSETWKRPAVAFGVVALGATVLGMGTSFPATRPLTQFLFDHLPGYGIYREPQKWLALLALFYAVFAAVGIHELERRMGERGWLLLFVAFLPLLGTHLLLWGFGGQVHTSQFPDDWEKADRIMEHDSGRLLFLPWNLYQPLPFADNRTIASPGEHFFSAETLVSGDAALARRDTTRPADPRDVYVSRVIARGYRLKYFGHLVAPLGARYIALANIADAPDYEWLDRQADLEVLYAGPDLTLYENLAWEGSVYGLAEGQSQDDDSLLPRGREFERAAIERLRPVGADANSALGGPDAAQSLPIWDEVAPTASPVTGTDRSCHDGWRMDHVEPVCHLGAFAAFPTPDSPQKLWRSGLLIQVVAIVISIFSAGILWGATLRTSRRSEVTPAMASSLGPTTRRGPRDRLPADRAPWRRSRRTYL